MPRILVIDDDAAIAEIVCINLEMAGYEVNQSPDGIQGQAMAIQIQPDLIVLDLMLPKVDGYTVCQRLRRDERTSDIPVLMLTALSQTQNKVEGFNAGADDYLTKPFEIDEFNNFHAHFIGCCCCESTLHFHILPIDMSTYSCLASAFCLIGAV